VTRAPRGTSLLDRWQPISCKLSNTQPHLVYVLFILTAVHSYLLAYWLYHHRIWYRVKL